MAAEIGLLLLRLLIWGGIPLALLVLIVGPARSARLWTNFWNWLIHGRQDPTTVFNRVVSELQKTIHSTREVLKQSEATQNEIIRNRHRSEENASSLEKEARASLARGDRDGARAALSNRNVEQLAIQAFQAQLEQQQSRITETKRRLQLLELQVRQYEVGRSILLTQLAEAQTLKQQYALANQFDPFSAVAAWQRAENHVEKNNENAQSANQVYESTTGLPLSGEPARVDSDALEAQLNQMEQEIRRG